mmetsp:Transcript_2747/g.4261  ORF Transcript_2747/g.4261 Transcript_2747/m.4261 type:complete len:136 (-) Transcript_2747:195-602(-)
MQLVTNIEVCDCVASGTVIKRFVDLIPFVEPKAEDKAARISQQEKLWEATHPDIDSEESDRTKITAQVKQRQVGDHCLNAIVCVKWKESTWGDRSLNQLCWTEILQTEDVYHDEPEKHLDELLEIERMAREEVTA